MRVLPLPWGLFSASGSPLIKNQTPRANRNIVNGVYVSFQEMKTEQTGTAGLKGTASPFTFSGSRK